MRGTLPQGGLVPICHEVPSFLFATKFLCSSLPRISFVPLCHEVPLFLFATNFLCSSLPRGSSVPPCHEVALFLFAKMFLCSSLPRCSFVPLCQDVHLFLFTCGLYLYQGLDLGFYIVIFSLIQYNRKGQTEPFQKKHRTFLLYFS